MLNCTVKAEYLEMCQQKYIDSTKPLNVNMNLFPPCPTLLPSRSICFCNPIYSHPASSPLLYSLPVDMETLLVENVIPFQFIGETKLKEKWTEEVENRLCKGLDNCLSLS